MIEIPFSGTMILITCLWVTVRMVFWFHNKRIFPKRELELILVYICLVVVARFTFFPFSKVDGYIQPLLFDPDQIFPPRINLLPMVYLLDYETRREALINIIGNTAMFVPLGIVWPTVFRRLDTHGKVIAAGMGFSLCIEILQLPLYDRVSDVDDLILNSAGFLIGYGIYICTCSMKKIFRK